MEAIIINREISHDESGQIRQLIESKNIRLFSNISLSEELMKHSSGEFKLTSDEKRQINYEIFDKTIQLGEKEVKSQALADYLTFDIAQT
ncbi:MAG: hypothetical protein K8R53_11460, partial [Bacteroidales bacterium]|nr:hypothetical protein [Bacteroidales bacterium]